MVGTSVSSMKLPGSLEEQPRRQVELLLKDCWKMAFEVQDVQLHDDFFAVGGNSLIAARFISQLKRKAGIHLSYANVYQARNIAHMADLILVRQRSAETSTCVPLRTRGSLPPLFMIHGVGGNILGFYNLVAHLRPDRPVYGIQAQGLLPDEPALIRLEEQAAYYLKEIRRIQPHGPYCFLGFSFGGLVAYEMAQQLRAQGEEIGLLGMLDTRQSDHLLRLSNPMAFLKHMYFMSNQLWQHTKRFNLRNKALLILNLFKKRLLRLSYQYSAARGQQTIAKSMKSVHDINMNAGLNYKIRPYDGHITLFRAMDEAEWNLPEDLGWGSCAQQGVTIHKIPGGHGQICMEPSVKILAEELTRCLTQESKTIQIA